MPNLHTIEELGLLNAPRIEWFVNAQSETPHGDGSAFALSSTISRYLICLLACNISVDPGKEESGVLNQDRFNGFRGVERDGSQLRCSQFGVLNSLVGRFKYRQGSKLFRQFHS